MALLKQYKLRFLKALKHDPIKRRFVESKHVYYTQMYRYWLQKHDLLDITSNITMAQTLNQLRRDGMISDMSGEISLTDAGHVYLSGKTRNKNLPNRGLTLLLAIAKFPKPEEMLWPDWAERNKLSQSLISNLTTHLIRENYIEIRDNYFQLTDKGQRVVDLSKGTKHQ